MRGVLFLFLVLFFVGCSKKVETPKWLYSTPNSSIYLYGVGVGYDKESAIKKALNNLVSQIRVNISSETIVDKGTFNNNYYKNFYQVIKSKVVPIDVRNYQIIKESHDDVYTYVMLRVKKSDIIKSLLDDVKLSLYKLNQKLSVNTPFNKLKASYYVLNHSKNLENSILTLKALGYNSYEIEKEFKNLITNALYFKENITFNYQSNCNYLKDVFLKYVVLGDSNYYLKVSCVSKQYFLLEEYVYEIKLRVDFNNEYSFNIVSVGKGVSLQLAKESAIVNLKSKLNKTLLNLFLVNNR